ncbi:hypothetical protein CQJ94_00635 [Glycomyces fuscus]|nr:hypothetical protein CQJ94_00635 [Glycomyces fuscus]
MVDATQTLELLRFADPGQSIAVEVECGEPLMSGEEGRFGAFIVVKSDFVHGRIGLVVSAGDLDDWERCLVPGVMEALNPGKDERHASTEEVPA